MSDKRQITPVNALLVALVATTIYVGALFALHENLPKFPGQYAIDWSLNILGDSIGGMTAPVALIWLIAAVITQRQELNLTKEELAKTADAMGRQAKSNARQVAIAHASAEANWQLSLLDRRLVAYNRLRKLVGHYSSNMEVDLVLRAELANVINEMKYVFGSEIMDWIKELDAHTQQVAYHTMQIDSIQNRRTRSKGSPNDDKVRLQGHISEVSRHEAVVLERMDLDKMAILFDPILTLPDHIDIERYVWDEDQHVNNDLAQ